MGVLVDVLLVSWVFWSGNELWMEGNVGADSVGWRAFGREEIGRLALANPVLPDVAVGPGCGDEE